MSVPVEVKISVTNSPATVQLPVNVEVKTQSVQSITLPVSIVAESQASVPVKILDLVKRMTEIAALWVAGLWTYWLFVQKRERWPKACLRHHIRSWPVAGDRQLVRVNLNVQNVGELLLKIRAGFAEVYQLKPWPQELTQSSIDKIKFRHPEGTEFRWPRLAYLSLDGKSADEPESAGEYEAREFDGYDIEPSESEELIFDFIIPAGAELVSVYSRIENAMLGEREFGWNLTTLFRIDTEEMIPKTGEAGGAHPEKDKPKH